MSKQWIVTMSLLAAGTAFAEGPIDYPAEPAWTSTLTRAEVVKAMLEPAADAPVGARLSRTAVRAELRTARAQGLANPFAGEDSGSFYLAQQYQRETQRLLASVPATAQR